MHSDIKKFWEDNGYNVSSMEFKSDERVLYHVGDEEGFYLICKQYRKNGELEKIYYLGRAAVLSNKYYSEEEMLKIIKLKAFL